MRKVKLDSQCPKSDEAFFEFENPIENKALNFAKCGRALKFEEISSANAPALLITFLKGIFIFLPGTHLLFYTSFGTTLVFLEMTIYRRKIELMLDNFLSQFSLLGLMVFLGILMTWAGLGDPKNRKHFIIPASLIVTGATLGMLARVVASLSDFADRMLNDFTVQIYLFPLALIVPTLAKSFTDRQTSAGKIAWRGL